MNRRFIFAIPLKKNIQIEYAKELTAKLDDLLKKPYRAYLENLPKGEPEPIGICVFKEQDNVDS